MEKTWQEAAEQIGYDAWLEIGESDEEQVKYYIYDKVDNCEHISSVTAARDVVFDAADSDWDTFDKAHDMLVDTEGDRINRDKCEDIDNVINRLAFWIMVKKALDYYEVFEIREGMNDSYK